MCGKPAIGGLREGEKHEWVLFLRDPSVVRGLEQEARQEDQGGDAVGPDQGGGREEGYLEGGADRNQGEARELLLSGGDPKEELSLLPRSSPCPEDMAWFGLEHLS